MVAAVRSWWGTHLAWGWSIVAVLTVALVVGAFVLPAGAATNTQTRVPTSTLASTQTWALTGGTSIWGVLDDAPPLGTAGDGDYVTHGTTAGGWWGGFAPFDLPDGATVTRVSMYVRARKTANPGNNLSARIQVNGVERVHGTALALINGTSDSNNYRRDWTTNPNTSQPWTVADVEGTGTNPLQRMGLTSTDADPTIVITQAYLEVEYTTPEIATVGDGVDLTTPVAVSPGDPDIVVDSFSLTSTGAGTVTSITLNKTGTATVSAVDIYTDANGNGAIDAGDVSIGSGSFGSPITITSQALNTTPKYYLVVVDIDAGAVNATSVTGIVTAAAGTGIDSFTYSDTLGYSRSADVQHTIVNVGNGTDPVAPPAVSPGQANVVVDSFTFSKAQGLKTPKISSVTVTKSGTAAVSAVRIFTDANGNGAIDAGDVSIGSGAFGSAIAITEQTIDATKSYLVVVDIGGAADGSSVSGLVTAASGTDTHSVTYNDTTNLSVTVQHTIVNVGNGTDPVAPTSVSPGQANVVVDSFALSKTQGLKTPKVNSVTVTKSGTAAVSAVKIFLDSDGDGVLSPAELSAGALGSGTFGSPISITEQTIDVAKSYLVVIDISGAAAAGDTVTGRVSAAAGTDTDSFTYNDTTSLTVTVQQEPTNVTIGNGTADPGPASVAPNTTGVVVDRFRIERTSGANAATVDTVTVTNSGTAPVVTAYIYTDTNNDGSTSGETLLGSASFGGATAAVDIADQVVGAVATPAYYIVVCDIGAASNGQTAIVAVTAATGSGTPVPTFAYSDTGNTFTVSTAPDTEPPTTPIITSATPGVTSPTIATVTWSASTDNVGVTLYRLYSSTTVDGTYDEIGSTAGLSLADVTGVAGQEYYYKVRAFDAAGNPSEWSSAAGPVVAVWVALPHATYTSDGRLCQTCHAPHRAATSANILRDTGSEPGELSVCYACHDGSGASTNIKTGPVNSFASALVSGHTIEAMDSATDLTNTCSSCHSPHRDFATNPGLPGTRVNGVAVAAADNSWCLACHNAANEWYDGVYPPASAPSRDAAGYPIAGTFPGPDVYANPAKNAHVSIEASEANGRQAGDCLYCHASHRSASSYDLLIGEFTVPVETDPAAAAYATLCFQCHGTESHYVFATPPSGATNIQQFVTAGGTRSGHRIKTPGGTLPVGAPLPCYDCHNPHGSTRGNKYLLSDELGRSLETTTAVGGDALVRKFCFTCHTTAGDKPVAEGGNGLAYGWDSVTVVYSTAIAAGKTIEGLPRDASLGDNVLRLPAVNGHYRDDGQSCYKCHGSSYDAGGANVHNPSGGVSQGGEACYACHTEYRETMDADGTDRAATYHHVMGTGGGTYNGDTAFAAGSYPAAGTDVYCMSCHVDHDSFNDDQASNLRADLTASSAGASTDYVTSGSYGVCVSCHGLSLAKDRTNQADDGLTGAVPTIDGALFATSAHQYTATSTFGDSSTFSANCVKCHDDENDLGSDQSGNTFGTHYSADRRIRSAFGTTPADPLSETHCYGCHTGDTDNGPDYYAAATMTRAAQSVETAFGLTSYHPVDGDGSTTPTVECVNCHNAHTVSAASPVSDPDDTYSLAAYGTDAEKTAFCMTCHDGTAPAYAVGATYVPTDVVVVGPNADKSGPNADKAHWSSALASGSIDAGEEVTCAECHDNHGSTAPKLLGIYDAATGTNTIGSVTITGNNLTVCEGCHTAASATAFTREAGTGYPIDGTWPGMSVYKGAGGIHKADADGQLVQWPGLGYPDGDCKNCHDVHGAPNTYDMLRGTFDPTSTNNDMYALCFECHDGSPSSINIMQYYPASSGGTGIGSNAGHQIKSTETGALPKGTGLPCYDCHNPHGSASTAGLLVMTQIGGATYAVGDATGEIDLSSPEGVRRFCFLCHTTATNRGTSSAGTGYTGIGTNDKVEGLSRTEQAGTNALKLSALAAHTESNAQSCLTCHGTLTADSDVNVHNPSSGAGGGPCFSSGCHGSGSVERLDKMVNDVTTYHHVLDGTDPDRMTYPTASQSTLYCLSCHVDHADFVGAAGNLRSSYNSTPGEPGVNSDFPGSGSYGVCVSCHSTAQPKSGQGTTQKAGGSATTPAISGPDYDVSAHDYLINDAAKVGYGDEPFRANCIKCHDDGATGPSSRQSGSVRLAPHYSRENRIADALGASFAGASTSTEENLCYRCHAGAGPNDGYGVVAMTAASRGIQAEFGRATKHPVGATAGVHKADEARTAGWNPANNRHVECEDCHNVHAATAGVTAWPSNTAQRGATMPSVGAGIPSGSTKGVWGVTFNVGTVTSSGWTGYGTFGSPTSLTAANYSVINSATYQWQICLKCHSRYAWTTTAPTVSLNLQGQTGGRQTDIGDDFNRMNYSVHPVLAPGKNQPPATGTNSNPNWTSTTYAGQRNINGTGLGTYGLSNTFTDGWLTTSLTVCTDCHRSSNWSAPAGPHGSDNKWLLSGVDTNIKVTIRNGTVTYPNSTAVTGGWAGNFCMNCHRQDVYGSGSSGNGTTDAVYGVLSRFNHDALNAACGDAVRGGSGLRSNLQWSGCVHCHGGRKSDASFNNPANTVVQSGAIHGVTMNEMAGNAGADPMGYRFMNGASWAGHTLADASGTSPTCYTLGTADNYSTCTAHGGGRSANNSILYSYPRPTN